MMRINVTLLFGILLFGACTNDPKYSSILQPSLSGEVKDSTSGDTPQYHFIRFDANTGGIIPWYSNNHGQSYDTCLMLVLNFFTLRNFETWNLCPYAEASAQALWPYS